MSDVVYNAGESLREYLERMGWVLRSSDGDVSVSSLGDVLLRALDEAEVQEEGPLDIVLDPDDPLAYSRLVGRIANAGPATIVDPYFRLDQLMSIAVNRRWAVS